MTIRPILMSASMVQATLREIENPGTGKTQTRRVLKVQPPLGYIVKCDDQPKDCTLFGDEEGDYTFKVNYTKGDQLYVREGHYHTDDGDSEYAVFSEDRAAVKSHLEDIDKLEARYPSTVWSKHRRFRPSIHMPRWASRITLEVTNMRVERLQGISSRDVRREGLQFGGVLYDLMRDQPKASDLDQRNAYHKAHTDAFSDLWDSLNGKPRANGIDISWDANPWVVAVSFKPRLQNVDEVKP